MCEINKLQLRLRKSQESNNFLIGFLESQLTEENTNFVQKRLIAEHLKDLYERALPSDKVFPLSATDVSENSTSQIKEKIQYYKQIIKTN